MALGLKDGMNTRGRGGSAVLAFLCAFALFVAQTLTLAHANSHEAAAPGHDTKTCVYHVNGDRPAAVLAPDAPVVAAPAFDGGAEFGCIAAQRYAERSAAVRARGPPLQD